MNILLIKPYWPYPYGKGEHTYNRIWPPLCLANCAALLEKEGHQVKIVDAHALRLKPIKIKSYIENQDKIFITSSSLDRWQCPNDDINYFLETVSVIKEVTAEVYITGYHGTVEPEKILNLTQAKAIIVGEPENTILELCRQNNFHKIKGICFKDKDRIVLTAPRELVDLKDIPVPAFHLLNFKKYFYEILGSNFSLFEISRGCNFKCKFCNKVLYGNGLRSKSINQIIDEIDMAVLKHKVKTGYFIDLDFLANKILAEELCNFLIKKKYNFKWCCQTRPDHLNSEILNKMKAAGCQLIHIGVEFGSQNSLDYYKKNISLEKIEEAVKLCKQIKIKTLSFFLFEAPSEEGEKTFKFAKKLNTDFVSFHNLTPYKGTNISPDNFKISDKTDNFIRKKFIAYYLNFPYIFKLDLYTISSGLRLFWGRIKTL